MRQFLPAIALLIVIGCQSSPQARPRPGGANSLDAAVAVTMRDARNAIDAHGVSDEAMIRIQESLARLAQLPGLIDQAAMEDLHGSAQMGVQMLASEGVDGICLYLVRFAPNVETPVHDHLTWGVIHVLEGRDRYVGWVRSDEGAVSDHANLRIAEEQVLLAGQGAYWLAPPHDIHSQEAVGGAVWELVMTGRDVTDASVTDHRHYFDPETGRVTHGSPQ